MSPDRAPGEVARRGLMLVLSSPSGAGKTTLSRRLLAEDAGFVMSVSVTTRRPRPGEVDGRDYFFIDDAEFARMAAGGELLEHATVFGNSYGTPKAYVEERLNGGEDVLFDIDWQGAQQLRAHARDDLAGVFVLPPTAASLAERLRRRAQDPEEVVAARMAKAADEISHWAEYDYVIVNDEVEAALQRLRAIVTAERLRRDRQTGLVQFTRALTEAL